MTLKHLKAAPLYYKPIFTKNSKGMSRIMTARIILAMMCFLCFGLKADASARSENGKETDSQHQENGTISSDRISEIINGNGTSVLNPDDIEEIDMGDGHTITISDGGNIIIETIRTNDYQRIITQVGDDISEFYEDYATGAAVTTLNGRVTDVFDMNAYREEISEDWVRFDSNKLIWGLAIVIGAVFIAGGIWSIIPSRKK